MFTVLTVWNKNLRKSVEQQNYSSNQKKVFKSKCQICKNDTFEQCYSFHLGIRNFEKIEPNHNS